VTDGRGSSFRHRLLGTTDGPLADVNMPREGRNFSWAGVQDLADGTVVSLRFAGRCDQ